ncbi:MFS transporter [Sulfolobus sp. A20]|uniref:MFS transporter n=1 Tax=Sulfolobaceae TaxID=118883 RepID=UPI000845FAEC|nr:MULTISPECIES: MFS transporter [unclassified Sulfolobus]TRM75363.1 MFS transporter [Sulfolobus sp. E5]TRM76077.1 MFS transporter [Sulfolobus sp. A20-N-F8]TRM79428.1 MFS transporter [Sulfolobus sp. B5]TRM81254.1 MFS transporter [Sulfolobus sp. D5]TRM83250.1 MFS transporter [Sulfolobus sp. A20-N-F6]TRM83705.1 MFS transporter [Sulfolobus sp. F3]TRM88552.1 MFS transporter [Sulfolobus sp. C3]TRM89119.1 MFS transporter [Sulfolobus sp. E3]TRM94815.1 MFS transporter [Sulfolobus sp. A20-N-G8]TRN
MEARNLALFVVVLGTLMSAVDTTIVILAIPSIAQELHTDLYTIIWVIILYLLVIAVFTTQLGRIGDIYGRSRLYNLGFAIFTIGSALCGASPSALFLVGFRGVQGLGAAMMQANSGAIVADIFPPNQRGRAYGYTSIGWNAGATLGIVLGGFITTFIGWRYIFYINVPIGIIAIILGLRYIKSFERRKVKLDIGGMLSLLASLSLIAYGSADIAGEGVRPLNIYMILGGIVLLGIFGLIERKQEFPIIDFGAFKANRVFTYSLMSSFMQTTGYLATAFIIIMYLQGIRGLSPFSASLLLVPGYVLASLVAPFTGRLSDKIGARIPATIGLALMISAVLLYVKFLTLTTPLYFIIIASTIGGLGSSLFFPANNSAIMANAPRGFYGGASGIARTLSNIGTLLSYTIAISIASITVPRYVAFEVFLGTTNLIGGVASSFLIGLRSAFYVSVGILAVGLVLSALRGKEYRTQLTVQQKQNNN